MNKLDTVQLKNGLTLYLYPDLRRHTTLVQFITKFGGFTKDFIYQGKEYHMPDGIAHLLEHYVVECNDAGNFLDILGNKQMNTNASTHFDTTHFYFDAVEDIEFGIDTLLKGLTSVSFQEEKMNKLKNPIYQEIRGKSDSKFYHSGILSFQNLFNHYTFRNIGGSIEEVKGITIDDLEVCYKAFYQPHNQVMIIAGNFDKEKVIKQITDFYEKINIPYEEVKLIPPKETIDIVKKEDTLIFKTPMDYVDISFKIDVSKYSPEENLNLNYYLSSFYNQYFGPISRLYQECVDEKIISAGINAGDVYIGDYLIISVGAYTHNSELFKKKVLDTIQSLNDFQEEAFDLDKDSAIIRMILRDESIVSMIMPFVDNVVLFKYPYLDEVKDVEAMNYKDYVDTIRSLDFSHYSIVTIKEKES